MNDVTGIMSPCSDRKQHLNGTIVLMLTQEAPAKNLAQRDVTSPGKVQRRPITFLVDHLVVFLLLFISRCLYRDVQRFVSFRLRITQTGLPE